MSWRVAPRKNHSPKIVHFPYSSMLFSSFCGSKALGAHHCFRTHLCEFIFLLCFMFGRLWKAGLSWKFASEEVSKALLRTPKTARSFPFYIIHKETGANCVHSLFFMIGLHNMQFKTWGHNCGAPNLPTKTAEWDSWPGLRSPGTSCATSMAKSVKVSWSDPGRNRWKNWSILCQVPFQAWREDSLHTASRKLASLNGGSIKAHECEKWFNWPFLRT